MKRKPKKKAQPLPLDPTGWPDFSIDNWPTFEPEAVDFAAESWPDLNATAEQ